MTDDDVIKLAFTVDTAAATGAIPIIEELANEVNSYALATDASTVSGTKAARGVGVYAVAMESGASAAQKYANQIHLSAEAQEQLAQASVKATVVVADAQERLAQTSIKTTAVIVAQQEQLAQTSIKTTAVIVDQGSKLETQMGRPVKELGRAKNGMAGFGQAAQQTSYALQDLTQGGIAAIANNLPGLVASLGGGPGLAGVIGIVGLAAILAKPFLAGLAESFGGIKKEADPALSSLDALKASLKEMQDRPTKLAIDLTAIGEAKEALAKLEAAQAAYDHTKGLASKDTVESKGAVEKAIGEAGGDQVARQLQASVAFDLTQADPQIEKAKAKIAELREQIKDIWKDDNSEGDRGTAVQSREGDIKREEAKIDSRAKAISKEDGGEASVAVGLLLKGPVEDLAKAIEAAAMPDLARTIRDSSPEMLKAERAFATEMDKQGKQHFEALAKAERVSDVRRQTLAVALGTGSEVVQEGVKKEVAAKAALQKNPAVMAALKAGGAVAGGDTYSAFRESENSASRVASKSGLLNPIQQMMAQARQARGDFKTTGQARKFNRLSEEGKHRYLEAGNDKTDAALKKRATNYLMRSGRIRDPKIAAKAAETMVNQARKNMNEATGDMETRMRKQELKATEDLISTLKEMADKGVPVVLK